MNIHRLTDYDQGRTLEFDISKVQAAETPAFACAELLQSISDTCRKHGIQHDARAYEHKGQHFVSWESGPYGWASASFIDFNGGYFEAENSFTLAATR